MTNWIIYVCLCFLLFCNNCMGMQAFELIESDTILNTQFQQLLESPLGTEVGPPVNPIASTDRYTLAVYLSRCMRRLRSPSLRNFNDSESLNTLIELIKNLSPEIEMLRQNAEEFILEIETRLSISSQTSIPVPIEKKINLDSVHIQAKGSSNKYTDLQSLIDLTVVGFNEIEGYLRVGIDQQAKPELHNGSNARVLIDEAKLSYGGSQYIDEIRIGKYHPGVGMGLSAGSNLTGADILANYQDYQFQIGYFDGLFASITTPMLLNLPVTFYTMQEKTTSDQPNLNPTHSRSDMFHSGLYFEHSSNIYKLRSELVEYNRSGYQAKQVNDQRSFAMSLDLFPSKRFQFGSSLVHTGEDFQARQSQSSLSSSSAFEADNPSLQKEVLKSLSRYFGKDIYSVPGTSDLKFNINYQANDQSMIELHFNKLYDHTRMELNRQNTFNLSTLNYRQKLRHNSELLISLQNLTWDQTGFSHSGFMQGHSRDNMQTVQTAYKFLF